MAGLPLAKEPSHERCADRIDQARTLFALHPALDRVYLERRIREETMGDHGIEALDD